MPFPKPFVSGLLRVITGVVVSRMMLAVAGVGVMLSAISLTQRYNILTPSPADRVQVAGLVMLHVAISCGMLTYPSPNK